MNFDRNLTEYLRDRQNATSDASAEEVRSGTVGTGTPAAATPSEDQPAAASAGPASATAGPGQDGSGHLSLVLGMYPDSNSTSNSATPTPPSTTTEPAAPQGDPNVDTLMRMGYSRRLATRSLIHSRNNLDQAAEYCIQHADDDAIQMAIQMSLEPSVDRKQFKL